MNDNLSSVYRGVNWAYRHLRWFCEHRVVIMVLMFFMAMAALGAGYQWKGYPMVGEQVMVLSRISSGLFVMLCFSATLDFRFYPINIRSKVIYDRQPMNFRVFTIFRFFLFLFLLLLAVLCLGWMVRLLLGQGHTGMELLEQYFHVGEVWGE